MIWPYSIELQLIVFNLTDFNTLKYSSLGNMI